MTLKPEHQKGPGSLLRVEKSLLLAPGCKGAVLSSHCCLLRARVCGISQGAPLAVFHLSVPSLDSEPLSIMAHLLIKTAASV